MPRNIVANMESPKMVAPAKGRGSMPAGGWMSSSLPEDLPDAERVERDEERGQPEHDREDAAANGFLQRVAGERRGTGAHCCPLDGLEVGLLERRAQDADLVDALAALDQIRDEAGHLLARRLGVDVACPGPSRSRLLVSW